MKKKIVTVAVSGAFDPLHVGHISLIRQAAKLGERLIVILNSDDFLIKKKGFVFWPFSERKEIMESIQGVDEVIEAIDEDLTVCRTLEILKPDIFAKGGDWTNPQQTPEFKTCQEIGCRLVTHIKGDTIREVSELSHNFKQLSAEQHNSVKIDCPHCDDHPMLREKCLYCKGTGKIEVRWG